jgi:hypothetical protein
MKISFTHIAGLVFAVVPLIPVNGYDTTLSLNEMVEL